MSVRLNRAQSIPRSEPQLSGASRLSVVLAAGQQVTTGGPRRKTVVVDDVGVNKAIAKPTLPARPSRAKSREGNNHKPVRTDDTNKLSPEARDKWARAHGMWDPEFDEIKPASEAMRRLWHGEPMPGREEHKYYHQNLDDRQRVKMPNTVEELDRAVRKLKVRPNRVRRQEEAKLVGKAKMEASKEEKREETKDKSRETRNANGDGHGNLTNVHLSEFVRWHERAASQ